MGYIAAMIRIPFRSLAIFALGLFAVLAAPAHAAKLSAADKAWIGKCMDQLKRENANVKIVRKYCVCMHDMFEDNESVSQSDMEHMFPPVHRSCNKSSGWK
jgi:hypothetical protein